MKPDLTPVICPLCDSPCMLVPGEITIRRGERELAVGTWWWKCLGDGCHPDTGEPLQFTDKTLGEWQTEQYGELWQSRFNEPLPGGRPLRSEPLSKVTRLKGYKASGDQECFCFGKYHPDELKAWVDENLPPGVEPKSDEYWDFLMETQDATRVYPLDLLPEGVGDLRGRWRITVEFWPDASE